MTITHFHGWTGKEIGQREWTCMVGEQRKYIHAGEREREWVVVEGGKEGKQSKWMDGCVIGQLCTLGRE
jgi:hypothetical protein